MRGSHNAWLGMTGDDRPERLYQEVTIPDRIASARLTYYLHVDATAPEAPDPSTLQVSLAEPAGAGCRARILHTWTGRDAAPGYRAHSADLSAWKGRTVDLVFECRNRPGHPAAFVLDDVSLTVMDLDQGSGAE